MKVTSQDIADKLGISQSTVSLALRSDPKIKEQTRQRVLEMADQLGYTPNQLSRSLKSGKTQTIAVLVAFELFEQVGRMVGGMAEIANEQSYFIKLLILDGKKDVSEFARQCLEHCVAGVVCIGLRPSSSEQMYEILSRHHTPVVMLTSNAPDLPCTHVLSDEVSAAQQVAEHLVNLGHHRIALLTGHMDSLATQRLTVAFWDKVSQLRDDPNLPQLTELGYHINDVAAHKARKLLKASPRPTAIFCTTDYMAAVTIRIARSMGLRVPEDLSVVGYGNLMISELSDPAMTTVDQPFARLGQAAMKNILGMAEQKEPAKQDQCFEIVLPTELILRESTCSPS